LNPSFLYSSTTFLLASGVAQMKATYHTATCCTFVIGLSFD
jgi:hypothetical protein